MPALRTRLGLAAALTSAIAVIAVSILGVLLTSRRLRSEVDRSLRNEAQRLARRIETPPAGLGSTATTPPTTTTGTNTNTPPRASSSAADGDARLPLRFNRGRGGGNTLFQVISANGRVVQASANAPAFGVDSLDRAVAGGGHALLVRDRHIDGDHFRIATAPATGGLAVQVARPLDDVDRTRRALIVEFGAIGILAFLAAGALGTLLARIALRPVGSLAKAAHAVADRRDPGMSVPVVGGEELATLGQAVNTMLGSLDAARRQQRQLIDDAAHELRTPLTSMRTNIEVLTGGHTLEAADHHALLADIQAQLEEFATLVADLGELSREQATAVPHDELMLDGVVRSAVARAQRRSDIAINVRIASPAVVRGSAPMLERAVLNVIDNAVKWSPPNSVVDVGLESAVITVTDHGPGIAQEDLPFVFDRFWRSASARGMSGSGLGLAIVRDVVELHGGDVGIERLSHNGTRVRISLPVA